jgi:putative peptidoglycan lipid II flippase
MVVGFFTLLGGLTGILVETSIAANLGLTRHSDAFYAAYTIPYIITTILTATGQFSLVPFFAFLEAGHSEEEQWKGFSYVLNMLFLLLALVALVGAVASPWLIRGIAPGFTSGQIDQATHLTRWLFMIIIPAGLAEGLRSFLLSRHRFALSTATGFIRNVVVIVFILAGFRRYGVYSIVLGYLSGYIFQVLVLGLQIVVCFSARYSLTLAAGGEAFRRLRGAGTAQLGAAFAWQGVVIVERIIASFLPPGTLTALNYGFKILGTLAELLGGSVGTAALPALSQAVARGDHEESRKSFRDMLEISLVLISPMVVFCLLLNQNIIRLMFQRGNFTPEATALMSMVFFYYVLSLLPFSFIRLLTFYLFARHEPGVFFRLSILYYGAAIGFDLFYVGVLGLGAKGIPLGLLSGLLVACGLAIRGNVGNMGEAFDRLLGRFTLKNLVAALLTGLVIGVLQDWVRIPATGIQNFLYLCELCGAGAVVYVASLAVLRALPLTQVAEVWPRPGNS